MVTDNTYLLDQVNVGVGCSMGFIYQQIYILQWSVIRQWYDGRTRITTVLVNIIGYKERMLFLVKVLESLLFLMNRAVCDRAEPLSAARFA